MRRWISAGPALAMLALSGCAGMGMTLEDVLAGMGGLGNNVRGEVEWVDTRRRELQVRSGYGGSTRMTYDSRTDVVYRNERYPVGALGVGDVISAQVERDNRGDVYAREILVEETRDVYDDRDDRDRRVERLEGRVARVNEQRGEFELRTSRATYTVRLPYNPGNNTRDRFSRLRAGQNVRIEGELLGNGRVELVRFL